MDYEEFKKSIAQIRKMNKKMLDKGEQVIITGVPGVNDVLLDPASFEKDLEEMERIVDLSHKLKSKG